jgi:hypothetical protein
MFCNCILYLYFFLKPKIKANKVNNINLNNDASDTGFYKVSTLQVQCPLLFYCASCFMLAHVIEICSIQINAATTFHLKTK